MPKKIYSEWAPRSLGRPRNSRIIRVSFRDSRLVASTPPKKGLKKKARAALLWFEALSTDELSFFRAIANPHDIPPKTLRGRHFGAPLWGDTPVNRHKFSNQASNLFGKVFQSIADRLAPERAVVQNVINLTMHTKNATSISGVGEE